VEKLSESENQGLELIEQAAIFIQKMYRGYHTRKVIKDHLRRLLVVEMI